MTWRSRSLRRQAVDVDIMDGMQQRLPPPSFRHRHNQSLQLAVAHQRRLDMSGVNARGAVGSGGSNGRRTATIAVRNVCTRRLCLRGSLVQEIHLVQQGRLRCRGRRGGLNLVEETDRNAFQHSAEIPVTWSQCADVAARRGRCVHTRYAHGGAVVHGRRVATAAISPGFTRIYGDKCVDVLKGGRTCAGACGCHERAYRPLL
jgi:hypothetical protein